MTFSNWKRFFNLGLEKYQINFLYFLVFFFSNWREKNSRATKMLRKVTERSGPQNVFLNQQRQKSPGSLLEMQSLRLPPRSTEPNLISLGPTICVLTSTPGFSNSWYILWPFVSKISWKPLIFDRNKVVKISLNKLKMLMRKINFLSLKKENLTNYWWKTRSKLT